MRLLKEYIRLLVLEAFSMEEFKGVVANSSNISEILEYADKNLERINQGQARKVYGLPGGDRVIKIAYQSERVTESDLGIRQNRKEVEVSAAEASRGIVTRVFEHDPEYRWVISERVDPIDEYTEDFYNETGIPEHFFYHGLEAVTTNGTIPSGTTGINVVDAYISTTNTELNELAAEYRNASQNPRSGLNAEGIKKRYSELRDSIRTYEDLKENEQAMEFLTNAIRLISNYDLLVPDVARVEHWGKAGDGRIKLYDYGAEREKG